MENTQTASGISDQRIATMAITLNKLSRLPAPIQVAAIERIIGLVDGLTMAYGGPKK